MKTNSLHSAVIALAIAVVSSLGSFSAPGQGTLTPPGAPAPTMKTLQQIEPRTPISSLPFTINTAGSFYLTTNLTGVLGSNGISITANSVTLDLAGFVLAGPGTNIGINLVGSLTNVVIRDGSIRNWSGGVEAFFSQNCRFERLQLSKGSFGVDGGDVTLVDSCQAIGFASGISVNNGGLIRSCVVSSNGTGIYAAAGCTILDCTAISNRRGIEGDQGCTIKNCTVSDGGNNTGILVARGSVLGCTVEGNQSTGIELDRGLVKDCTVINTTGDAITLFINCHAVGNTCVDNTGSGIRCIQGGHSVVGNMVTANGRGIASNPSTGNLIIQNRARDNSTNYDIGSFNTSGPIVNSATITTSSNPHANYSY